MSTPNKEAITTLINTALNSVYESENYLFNNEASERTIAFHFARVLYEKFKHLGYDVDIEYNLNIEDKKMISLLEAEAEEFKSKLSETARTDLECRVFPDIIIHKRGSNNDNLAIFELKRNKHCKFDEFKLKKYKSSNLNYKYAFSMLINHDSPPEIKEIET